MVMDCCGQALSYIRLVTVQAMAGLCWPGMNVPEDELEKRVAGHNSRETSTVSERAQRYKLYVKRAMAQLEDGMPK